MDDRRLQTRETDLRTTRHPPRQLHASRHVSDRIHDRYRLQEGLSRARIGSLELQQLLNLGDRPDHMRVITQAARSFAYLGQVSGWRVYEIGLAGGSLLGSAVDIALRMNVT